MISSTNRVVTNGPLPRFIFRVDASVEMGSGHVMRCLALAQTLRAAGADCQFVSLQVPGNLGHVITDQGFRADLIPVSDAPAPSNEDWLPHTRAKDAKLFNALLADRKANWVVVDHYGLDAEWERAISNPGQKVMVIDDLANRDHCCDLLLDQNLGRNPSDYDTLLAKDTLTLVGPNYALLRQEFMDLRDISLASRDQSKLRRLMISMGGSDKENFTLQVLAGVAASSSSKDLIVTVILGSQCPHVEEIQDYARTMKAKTKVLVGVNNMAELMACNDIAIGAAGSTTWERFCLGLPSLLVKVAANQELLMKGVLDHEVALVTSPEKLQVSVTHFLALVQSSPDTLISMARRAALLVDGAGAMRVAEELLGR